MYHYVNRPLPYYIHLQKLDIRQDIYGSISKINIIQGVQNCAL